MINELGESEYIATMAGGMSDITAVAVPVLDIWPYAEKLAAAGMLHPHVVAQELVEAVYCSTDGRWHHVLLPTAQETHYIILVIDVLQEAILGYFNLNLEEKYGR